MHPQHGTKQNAAVNAWHPRASFSSPLLQLTGKSPRKAAPLAPSQFDGILPPLFRAAVARQPRGRSPPRQPSPRLTSPRCSTRRHKGSMEDSHAPAREPRQSAVFLAPSRVTSVSSAPLCASPPPGYYNGAIVSAVAGRPSSMFLSSSRPDMVQVLEKPVARTSRRKSESAPAAAPCPAAAPPKGRRPRFSKEKVKSKLHLPTKSSGARKIERAMDMPQSAMRLAAKEEGIGPALADTRSPAQIAIDEALLEARLRKAVVVPATDRVIALLNLQQDEALRNRCATVDSMSDWSF